MRKAIICGSGVAGLSAAIALAKKGWSIDVFERSPSVREIGSGIFIKGNGLRVLECYGLLESIRQHCVVPREAIKKDYNGRTLQRRVIPQSNAIWNIHRQFLIRALLDKAVELGARIHTGCHVKSVAPTGTVTVGDKDLSADLVVGADGFHSTIRHSLGLDQVVRLPTSGAIRFLVPRTDHESENNLREYWSGRLRVGISTCTATDVSTYLVAPLRDPHGSRVPLDAEYWSRHFPGLEKEKFFERASQTIAVHYPYPRVSIKAWSAGCVAMVGDAAHALPPTLGQGASLALMNTLLLAEYVSTARSVPEALKNWEDEWRWVTDRTQIWSGRYDRISSEWPAILSPVRNTVIWAIGKSRRFNSFMRVADRVDAPSGRVLAPTALRAL